MTEPSRPRAPAYLQIALSLGVAVLLAAVALTTRQSPPPAIAEFAPQAAEQIKEQPKEQASQFGSGAGEGDCPPGAACAVGPGAGAGAGGGGEQTTTTLGPSTSAPPRVAPASIKRCVGDPPRQIEDPQSPPCIPFWDDANGNGGATSPGVTKDTITIAAPNAPPELYRPLEAFFNNRFQLYGRKIQIRETNSNGTAGADTAKQIGAFASLTSYFDPRYYRQLVKHKILGMYRTTEFSDSELAASAPYLWGYTMSYTQILASLGDWACHRLVGLKAAHAGPELAGSERVFGIQLNVPVDSTLNVDVLKSALEQCGARVPFTTIAPSSSDNVRARNDVAKMKELGVTTLICLCVTTNLSDDHTAADIQGYHPEWIITNYPQLVQGASKGSQSERVFGVSFEPMDRVADDHPQIWALREVEPNNTWARERSTLINSNDIHYRGFLVLLSGIQMAGPNLTPETFRAGLQKTTFPNPDHPIMPGKVGFQGDFSMTNDGTEFWMSKTAHGPYTDTENGPTMCWVDGGRRHARGTWPKGGDKFFTGSCDTGDKSVA